MTTDLDFEALLNSRGSVVTYRDNEPSDPLRWGTFTGLVVDAQKTNLGNVRLRIRLKDNAPFSTEKLERLVYSNNGTVTPAENQDTKDYANGVETEGVLA